MRKLTVKQERFVEEILVDTNAARAARIAGYNRLDSALSGWRNLRNPRIKAAIKAGKEREAL